MNPSQPLPNPRHEAFAQALALDKPATEAYRRAGYAPKHADTAGPRLSGNVGIQKRVAAIKAAANRSSKLTKERALELLGTIAEDGEEKTGDRIAAMRTVGSWCGWETGTEAEQAAAGNTRDLVEAVKSLTHGTKRTAS